MKNKINIYLVSFTSTILRLVQNAGIIILMSHVLSFELFSNYIYGFTVFGIISLFVDAGSYNKVLSSKCVDLKKYILESIVIRTVIYIIPILFFIIYFVVDTGKINWLFLIAGCVVLLSSITETYYVFLKVRGEFYLELGLVVIQFLLIFLFLFLLKVGLVGYFIAILLPRFLIVFIVFFININNIKYINVVIRVKRILKYYQEQWDFNIDSISSGFNLNVDQYLITFYLGKDALTVYQTASKIYSSFISLASAVGAVIIPRAMILNGVSNKFRAIMLPFVIFSMVFSIAHFILAPSISNLLFNLPIKLNESVFIILSIVIFVRYLSAAAGSSLMIIGLQKIRATINILVNIITVIVAVLLGFFIQYDINKIILLVLFSQILMLLIYIAFIMKVRNESIHK